MKTPANAATLLPLNVCVITLKQIEILFLTVVQFQKIPKVRLWLDS